MSFVLSAIRRRSSMIVTSTPPSSAAQTPTSSGSSFTRGPASPSPKARLSLSHTTFDNSITESPPLPSAMDRRRAAAHAFVATTEAAANSAFASKSFDWQRSASVKSEACAELVDGILDNFITGSSSVDKADNPSQQPSLTSRNTMKQHLTPPGSNIQQKRERRDSGVGCSLTRAPTWTVGERKWSRIRWHSFQKSRRPSSITLGLKLDNLTSGQFMVLRRFAFLRLTALMDKYIPSNTRSGFNWALPRSLMKRWNQRSTEYKGRVVFGVPLHVTLQRSGQVMPSSMQAALNSLRLQSASVVGIFRKAGVKSRIQSLKQQLEAEQTSLDFNEIPAHDTADLLKQYLREMPECLLTNKMSETLIKIFMSFPLEDRLEAVQLVMLLMPDENREVLVILLDFLHHLASLSAENNMTASNLALCLAPSLFRLSISSGRGSGSSGAHVSPRRPVNAQSAVKKNKQRSLTSVGVPDQKDLMEQRAACEALAFLIEDHSRVFRIPESAIGKYSFSYLQEGEPVKLDDLGKAAAAKLAASSLLKVAPEPAAFQQPAASPSLYSSNQPTTSSGIRKRAAGLLGRSATAVGELASNAIGTPIAQRRSHQRQTRSGSLSLTAQQQQLSSGGESPGSLSPVVSISEDATAAGSTSPVETAALQPPLVGRCVGGQEHSPSSSLAEVDANQPAWAVYMESCIQGLLKESRDKFRGWISVSPVPDSTGSTHNDQLQLSYKKLDDGHPLRLWKCSIDVEAPPCEVLNRLLRERHLCDDRMERWHVVERLSDNADVFQFSIAPTSVATDSCCRLSRDFCELRYWKTNVRPRGAAVLVSTSVRHPQDLKLGHIKGVVLASRYLIEPSGTGVSRLTHVCRIDYRGYSPDWYNKNFGLVCAHQLRRLRASFDREHSQIRSLFAEKGGPETKV